MSEPAKEPLRTTVTFTAAGYKTISVVATLKGITTGEYIERTLAQRDPQYTRHYPEAAEEVNKRATEGSDGEENDGKRKPRR